jgi:type I restriction enzyme S subunit
VNVNRGRFHDDDFVFISEEDADRLSKFESFPEDVLLVHKGTLGEIGLMPYRRRFKRYIMGNSMLRVRCDRTKLLPEFLYYWLRSPEGRHYLFSRVSQVGVPQIQRPLTTLREAALPVPPVGEQRAILRLLVPLDDKIDLNRRLNRTLEAIARAIFKTWFIDFEPVRAKAAGATSFLGMPQRVFDQLPEELTEGERGPIPKGWEYTPIGDLVETVGGGTPSTKHAEYWDGGEHPFCTPKDMSGLTSPVLLDTERHITKAGVNKISSGQLPIGTVLLSSRAPIGYLAIAETPVSVNQGIIAMLTRDIPNTFVLLWTEAKT